MKMKNWIVFLGIITLLSCNSDRRIETIPNDWRTTYLKQEDFRVVETLKGSKYQFGNFISEKTNTSFKTYNSEGKLIGENNTHFYHYDSAGLLTKELYCGRTCKFPIVQLYFHNSNGQVIRKAVVYGSDTTLVQTFQYNNQGMIIKESKGDSTGLSIEYSYNPDSTRKSSVTTEFNSNIKEWITKTDSFYYDAEKRLIRSEMRIDGKDLLKISRFKHDDSVEIKIDTTITSIKTYQLDPNADIAHHAYYGKTKRIFDSKGRISELVVYKPDYTTPYYKQTYSYERKYANK